MNEKEVGELLEIARAHREHERYHSMAKLEQAAALRRDSNALKVLADRWLQVPVAADPGVGGEHDARGCEDLNGPAAVTTTGILFMEGEPRPGELTAMLARFEDAAHEYERLSRWLAEKMAGAWPRLGSLLTPELIEAARPRFAALARTTAAGSAYGLAARLLTAAASAMRNQDLTPAGVRADPVGAAAMLRTSGRLVDMAAAVIAEAAAGLGLSDPDWTSFIATLSRTGQ